MRPLALRLAPWIAAALAGCGGSGPADEGPAALRVTGDGTATTTSITLIHVNDTHSQLDAFGPKDWRMDGTLGGLTKAATVIARARLTHPGALLVHAGDLVEGDLYWPLYDATGQLYDLALLRQLGLDVMAVGNHELNYGSPVLAGALAAAGVNPAAVSDDGGTDVLSANLVFGTPDTGLSAWVKPHVIRTVNGLRVGIFALTTPYEATEQFWPDTLVGGDPFHPDPAALFVLAGQEVAALRAQGVDLVVLLSHLGLAVDDLLAATLPAGAGGLDVIVGAHDHLERQLTSFTPGQTIVVEAGQFYEKVGVLELSVRGGAVVAARHALLPVGPCTPRSPALKAQVDALKTAINAGWGGGARGDVFRRPVGFALGDLEKDPVAGATRRDSAVGDLAADALRTELGADLGITTSGFLHDKIYRGPVVADDLFRALPYGINPAQLLGVGGYPPVVIDPVGAYTFTGDQLLTALQYAVVLGETPEVSRNVRVTYQAMPGDQPPVLVGLTVNGVPIAPGDATPYTVAMNVFLWGVVTQAFGLPIPPAPLTSDQFEVLRAYVEQHPLLWTPPAPRVVLLP